MAGPIIVGVDGSEQSNNALAWAVDHAQTNQPIHVVHAFSPLAELAMAAAQHDWTEQRQRRARELDMEWVAEARERGVVPYTSIVDEDAAGALISKVETCEGSMIVVGPHGSGRGRSLGRVTRTLLHELPVPVVVARRPERSSPGSGAGRVLVAVGYGEEVNPAIAWAADHAQKFDHSLELCHVVGFRPMVPLDSPTDMLASYLGGSMPVDLALSELEDHAEEVGQRYPDLEIVVSVERGSVVRQILARSQDAALVVLGQSRVEPLTRNLIASRTLGIVSQLATSVAVVPR